MAGESVARESRAGESVAGADGVASEHGSRRTLSRRPARADAARNYDKLIAAAADLVRDKDSREPAVVVRGLGRHVTPEDGPGAAALLRPRVEDLFA